MFKKDRNGAPAKPRAGKASRPFDFEGAGSKAMRVCLWMANIIIDMFAGFGITVAIAVYLLPMTIVYVADMAGVGYDTMTLDFVILVGAPGVMIAVVYAALAIFLTAVLHRLVRKFCDSLVEHRKTVLESKD